jgi:hypothetical protein
MTSSVRNLLRWQRTDLNRPLGWPILVFALIGGLLAGSIAQLLGQVLNPFSFLGWATAPWMSIGFLFARRAARTRSLGNGTIWAGATAAVYLLAWLLAYCVVFGLCDSAGFMVLWRDERLFEMAAVPAGAIIGFIAAGSLRPGLFGSTCLAGPLAWSLPEVIRSVAHAQEAQEGYLMRNAPAWQSALALCLPTLILALIPLIRCRRREVNWLIFVATAAVGGTAAYFLLRVANHGVF